MLVPIQQHSYCHQNLFQPRSEPLITEYLPRQVKPVRLWALTRWRLSWRSKVGFFSLQHFNVMMKNINKHCFCEKKKKGLEVVLYCCAVVAMSGAVLTVFATTETQNKSLEEIEREIKEDQACFRCFSKNKGFDSTDYQKLSTK